MFYNSGVNKLISKKMCKTAEEKFLKACGKTNQIPMNLGMVWKYDESKGMTVTTNLGISMRESQNGVTDFGFTEFYFDGKKVYDGEVCSDIDEFLKILKDIVTKNT